MDALKKKTPPLISSLVKGKNKLSLFLYTLNMSTAKTMMAFIYLFLIGLKNARVLHQVPIDMKWVKIVF